MDRDLIKIYYSQELKNILWDKRIGAKMIFFKAGSTFFVLCTLNTIVAQSLGHSNSTWV